MVDDVPSNRDRRSLHEAAGQWLGVDVKSQGPGSKNLVLPTGVPILRRKNKACFLYLFGPLLSTDMQELLLGYQW